ncbi:MAG TPA: tRNA lysidine(34) synthetase TilS [Anaerolineae bacterium]|nr:tRNA lysidine(34) synthetase TilS [Anaerolineae bacterium]
MALLRDVQDYSRQHRLLEKGELVVVGVSGGPDSVTLLHVLKTLPLCLSLHVAHLHHGIRGADADADADFVAALAAAWGLPCTIERADVPALARREKLPLEEAARRARYAFLGRIAQQNGAYKIAVGHNADDQAETVLMHLLRGAGPAGLRGMLPRTCLSDYHLLTLPAIFAPELTVIRPLLATPRAAIVQYCEAHALETRSDLTNLDTTLFRNRLRHEVLPYLADINPRIAQRLRHLAEVVRADYDLLQEFIHVAWDALLLEARDDALLFNLRGWREQPLATQRALIRQAAYHLRCTLRDVDFVHIENALHVALHGDVGAEATLPRGLRLMVGYTTLTIADHRAHHLPPEQPWLPPGATIPLSIPGVVELPGGWTLWAQPADHWDRMAVAENNNPFAAWVDATALSGAAYLRTRRPGDRFCPQGLGGAEVSLSDFLINAKVPRAWRDHLPLVEAGGRLLWVAGLRLSEAALVRPDTAGVVALRFQEPQEQKAYGD